MSQNYDAIKFYLESIVFRNHHLFQRQLRTDLDSFLVVCAGDEHLDLAGICHGCFSYRSINQYLDIVG